MKTNDFRETKVNNYSRSNALSISETMKRSNDLLFSLFFKKEEILIQISIGYKRYVQNLRVILFSGKSKICRS